MRAYYIAYQDVFDKFTIFKSKNNIVMAATGGFTNNLRQPEGLTIEKGEIVNDVLLPDRHGLIVVLDNGGIKAINLKREKVNIHRQSRWLYDCGPLKGG